ncbi:fused response regulator/phosphatase [Alkaliphilus peptidifermentans]|uniref:Stage 0 sporulation protein A homolog n=1 Tax=Alkaliphilus peptidifermentans DSM 18978 TaxID=1120976 RepID=A0A1G5HQ79_9FIRM|nr:fused response regulator/phosphatase [Alkaliphilus peptidifermentans]SCY65579.1 Response regulator receiver domain-containing protein [Alkaliphilus peptidifermentans DSM 18978]
MITTKILILQPQESIPCFMKDLLRRYGYEVIQMAVKEETNRAILEVMPDLIILNSFEGQDNGIETFKGIKEHNILREIPFIVQFNGTAERYKIDFINLEVNDYIEQPYHESELILKIKNQLKIVKLQRKIKSTQKALEESISVIQNQKVELERNLSLAAKIQESLIPKTLGNIPNCSFIWHFQPSGKVGGDIFDAFMLDDDHMGLYMIDVMGHGVASSMLAVALSEFLILDVERGSPLKRKINEFPFYEIISPLEVINYLNKRFPFDKYKHYFTIFYMVLNVKTGVLKYVRAAHPSPILIKNDGAMSELDGYGTPIGFEFGEGYEEKTVCLDTGDTIIVYTDGLMEIKDEEGKSLEYEGIIDYFKNEINFENHHFTLNLKKLTRSQAYIKDDISILEMKWIKFI